ncbi:MAG: hypothetical protein ABF990_13605 [Acetobacter sp.]|uniref:hypothetical protein n=2 Tax=Acetobacter sp. TaxID=440 RepID=UPI0039EC144B
MSFVRFSAMALLLALPLSGQAIAAKPCSPDDGRLELSMHGVSIAVGYMWGRGTLSYAGRTYPVSIKGGGMLSFGSASFVGTGCVRNLGRLKDFNGTYWTIGGDVALGRGPVGIDMENARGVDIAFSGHAHGAHVAGQISRLYLSIDNH